MATNEELNKQYKEQLKSVQALERFTKNITSQQKAQLKAERAKLATIEKRIAVEEAYFDSFDSFSRKYQSLGKPFLNLFLSSKKHFWFKTLTTHSFEPLYAMTPSIDYSRK